MRSFLRRAAPALWYLALTILVTWPLARDPLSRLGALHGPGDPYLNLWILGWDLQTLSDSPLAVLSGCVFDASIFHPARQTLAYSDHLLLVAAAVWPVYAASGSVVLAYNLVLLGSLFAAALAMHALASRVTGSAAGALAAGTIWGFWPYHIAHLGHLQLQALYAMPLALLALHRLVAGGRARDAAWLGAATAFMAATSVYYGVIGTLGLAVSAVALTVATGGRHAARLAGRLALAGLVGGILVAPFVWPYWEVQAREGFARNLYEAAQHAATPASYVSAPAVNALYGATGWLRTDRGAESELFPGVAAIVLAGVGLWAARRRRGAPLALSSVSLVVTGFVLSLGPDGVRPLYAALHRWVFGFEAIRAPARFGVLVALGLALLAALGMREIERRFHVRDRSPRAVPWPCVAVLALIALEYVNTPLAWAAAPRLSTPVGAWLRAAPGPGAVVYLPFGSDLDNTPAMVESLEHGRPIVNGYSGQRPAFFSGVVDALRTFPSVESLWTLKDLDVRYIVSPPIEVGEWPLAERARFAGEGDRAAPRVIYELAWSDEVERRLGPPSTPRPPDLGPVTFEIGERLAYGVTWDGPTGTIRAGTVTLGVEPPPAGADGPAGAAYRLTLAARTAPWIARFFEADDRFATTADATLRPLVHERALREGRRVVDRRVTFDLDALVARAEDGAGQPVGPPVRLWPQARDAIAALYYVRTLDLQPGQDIEVPVFENMRNSTAAIRVVAAETISVAGRRWDTVRLDVVLTQRVPRRQPPRITVWLARDRPRPLVAAEVRAVFGNLRVELGHAAPG